MTQEILSMNERSVAIAEIERLMRIHDLTLNDLVSIQTESQTGQATRILSYLGGTLVLAGLAFFLSMQWAHLDSVLRVTLTFGPGLIALIMAIILGTEKKSGYLSTPLFTLAALFQTTGLFVFLGEYAHGNNDTLAIFIVTGIMTLQFLTLFFSLKRPAALFFSLIFAHLAVATVFDLMGIRERYAATALGLSGLMIATALARSAYVSITSLGFIISGFTFVSGWFIIVKNSPLDITLIGISVVLIYASVQAKSRALLFVSVITLLGYLGYYTDQYFKDIVGWPIALIILGLIMIVSSHYAIKLGQRLKTN